MPSIKFQEKIKEINSWNIVHISPTISTQLPSRSQVMVSGTIDAVEFQAPLEPDGRFSHWLHIDKKMLESLGKKSGDSVTLSIEATKNKDWPEPDIPADVQSGIVDNVETHDLWKRITPMSRWEWLRWIGSTTNPGTRAKRIVVSRSKLLNGLRRPCCFNRSMCCVPNVSKNGVLVNLK